MRFLVSKISHLRVRSIALAIPIPRFAAVRFAVADRTRFWIAIALVAATLASLAAYVVAVNAILLAGETIRREETALRILDQENALLASRAAERQSPLWLERQSRLQGLTEAGSIRYLRPGEALARLTVAP
ncbi:MAG: hypothetical protein A3B37_03575 [Candidatus Sungbacteria bacterium RIFCSPLOWO2_01_FULL_59_16]|uniref:Cell division protein FtsL n=1 Tax=Candidatus Sungbacteria bacterium RIFCSPLOWO2_01_FULL_59_16 TaxID=1802280 RepID=A0A1G2LBL5_9BACT|nr:MAG: hypothetical protein A3B37_03575 [Candidatus Sungbacteria bacterium RIFCSPLOWO2_01_FULL_59_16]